MTSSLTSNSLNSPSPYLPQNALPLAQLPEKGPAPKSRLSNPYDAQTLAVNLWNANKQRMLKDAAVQSMFDGNPPYNSAKMRAAGRASQANFSTLEGSSLLATACAPYYDLFAGDRRYTEVTVDYDGEESSNGTPPVNEEEKQRWGQEISGAFDYLLQNWDGFDTQMQLLIGDFVAFGRGYAMFDDVESWHFQKIAHYRVMVPDGTSIDLDRLPLIVVLHNWQVPELYRLIEDEASATAAGWNVAATRRAIAAAVPTDPAVPMDAMAAQQQLRDSDIYISARNATVQTATIFVREFNGKWSELMVRRDMLPSNSPLNGAPPAEFLFEYRNKFDDIRNALNPFFFSLRDGSWNGQYGLGRDIFTAVQILDRVSCAQADAIMLRSSIVVQARQALDKERLNLLQIGALTVIPENLEIQQSSILGDIPSTVEVSDQLKDRIERNTGVYRPTLDKGQGNPQTLGEFQAKFAQATVLSVSACNRFYAQLDRLYEQILRRVLVCKTGSKPWQKACVDFRKRCQQAGVPDQLLNIEKLCVKAWRVIGNGSAAMRQQQLGQFMSLYPMLPPGGQQNLLADIICTGGSTSQLKRYMPPAEMAKLPTDQQAMAMLENAALKQGAPVAWTPSQNNIVHADTHLAAAGQAIASLEQGAQLTDILGFLEAVGPHVAQHLQAEGQNPATKDHVKALVQSWQQLTQVTDKLHKQAQAQMQQQAERQQQAQKILTDQDLEMMKIQADVQTSRFKAGSLMQLKKERQDFDLALKNDAHQKEQNRLNQQHASELARADAATATDINLKRLSTVSQVQNDRLKAQNSKRNGE